MPSQQGIRAGSMLFHSEGRWLPPAHVVAGSTFVLVGPFRKLSIMRIGFVTIDAFRKNQRFLKVPIRVALRAVHSRMFSIERELCFRMVEALIHRAERNLLPTRGAVAGRAALRKTSTMWVFVAVRAQVERDTRIARLVVRARRMALGARYRGVQSGQRIARRGVIELTDAQCFPVFEVVALLAALSEPPGVRVLMAGSAGGRQTEIGPVQILDLDGAALLRINS